MSSNPFEAVAAAANNNNYLRTGGSDISSSLSSSTTELPSSAGLTDTLAPVNSSLTVDISRHPSGIVPVLQYKTEYKYLRKSFTNPSLGISLLPLI